MWQESARFPVNTLKVFSTDKRFDILDVNFLLFFSYYTYVYYREEFKPLNKTFYIRLSLKKKSFLNEQKFEGGKNSEKKK